MLIRHMIHEMGWNETDSRFEVQGMQSESESESCGTVLRRQCLTGSKQSRAQQSRGVLDHPIEGMVIQCAVLRCAVLNCSGL